MSDRVDAAGLLVARPLYDFIGGEAIPGTGVTPARFWEALAALVRELGPQNRALLAERERLEAKIDESRRDARHGLPGQAGE